jgi:alpha-galactosidase
VLKFPPRALCLFVLCAGSIAGFDSQLGAATVVRVGFASISNDPDAGTWTISSTGASLILALDPARDFQVVRLVSPTGREWTIGPQHDTTVKLGTTSVPFGNRAAGFVYRNVTTSVHGTTVQLDATFDLPTARLRATRHYAVTSGSTAFETWTTFEPLGVAVVLSDLNAFRLTVPAGRLHWLNGLQGDDANQPRDTAFSLQERDLSVGERLVLGAEGRSSEQTVPWFAIDGASDEFFAGLMWSGAWSFTALRSNSGLELTLGLAAMSTTVSSAIDSPHAFFGAARGGVPAAAAALRTFAIDGVRDGRAFDALVTYNTWFAYGVAIDDAAIRAEIDGAAQIGAELFVMDAGWYVGAGRLGADDFSSGLGTWQVDPSRFPDGLRTLTDYAHDRGLKFGLWVEPERVALATVNQRGLAQEPWLAKRGGTYGSADNAQICFGAAAARQWVLDQLVRLIDEAQPDYLKWDNNFWINCDRGGHGHGSTDGNFSHVNGLYQVLAELRSRYPDLRIENVSGGGNRLDFGMLRYSDVAWMDDRSAPSIHVRQIIQGLSVVFPPAYLLSFVMDHETESLHGAADMPLYFRSRMPGTLGLCFLSNEFEAGDAAQMTHEIDIYKELRRILRSASGSLLTEQAMGSVGPAWDVVQLSASGNRDAVVSAFQRDSAVEAFIVKPIGLRPLATYQVVSVDRGVLGEATGADLMADGISLVEAPYSAAHILVLTQVARRPD